MSVITRLFFVTEDKKRRAINIETDPKIKTEIKKGLLFETKRIHRALKVVVTPNLD